MKWHTEKRKLKDLKTLKNNPRTITDKGFEELGKDIDKVGHFRPLVLDGENTILAGNQRYRQLLSKHGEDYEVEVTVPESPLTEKQKKQIIILDNKHRGEDDLGKLATEFADVVEDLGFIDIIPDTDSDLEEFEQFDVDTEPRQLIIFIFETKEEQAEALKKLGVTVNRVEGVKLTELLK